MGKLDNLRRGAGSNAAESMGAGVALGLPVPETAGKPAHLEGVTRSKNLVEIAVGQIVRDDKQPRETFTDEEMDALVESVTTRGVLQPIRVRWDGAISRYKEFINRTELQFTSVSNVLKTKHDTVKNSIGNIR